MTRPAIHKRPGTISKGGVALPSGLGAALALIGLLLLGGCATTAVSVIKELRFYPLTPEMVQSPDTHVLDVKPLKQIKANLCGAAALAMVLNYWGTDVTIPEIVAALGPPGQGGYSGDQLRGLARRRKYAAFIYRGSVLDLFVNLSKSRPLIIIKSIADINHFVVVMGVTRDGRLIIADPARGAHVTPTSDVAVQWARAKFFTLLVAPTMLKPKPPPKTGRRSTPADPLTHGRSHAPGPDGSRTIVVFNN